MCNPRHPFGGGGGGEETDDISDYNTFTFLDISPTLHIAKYGEKARRVTLLSQKGVTRLGGSPC